MKFRQTKFFLPSASSATERKCNKFAANFSCRLIHAKIKMRNFCRVSVRETLRTVRVFARPVEK